MNNRTVAELLKTRKALKKKYRTLKGDIVKSQSDLEKTYQPITQPLKELLATIGKSDQGTFVKHEPKREFKEEYYHTTPTMDLEDEETFLHDPSLVRPEYGESF